MKLRPSPGCRLSRIVIASYGTLFLQFAGLILLSVHIFNRFNLGIDFAEFNSAWTEIGKGHFDPYSTISGFPYVNNHFELIMWPLALLYPVFHSSFALLVVQDASIAGTNLVVLTWIVAALERQGLSARARGAATAISTVALLLNPEVYQTVALDFHFEPTAVFFCVLAGYDLWAGRQKRFWLWLAFCLSCGDIGGIYAIGLGISGALAMKRTRLTGLLTITCGIGWVGLISSLGANKGSLISAGYSYLAGRPEVAAGFGGLVLIAGGVVMHPSLPLALIGRRIGLILGYMRPVGMAGFVSPWGFGVPFITLLTSTIQYSPLFIETPFQEFAVYPFLLVGIGDAAADSCGRGRSNCDLLSGSVVLASIPLLVSAVVFDANQLPPSPHKNATDNFYSPAEAATLHEGWLRIPGNAEVIASVPLMGRLGQRKYIYPFDSAGSPIPVHTNVVVLVVDEVHPTGLISIPHILNAVTFTESQLNAHVIVEGNGAYVLEWHRRSGSTSVNLP